MLYPPSTVSHTTDRGTPKGAERDIIYVFNVSYHSARVVTSKDSLEISESHIYQYNKAFVFPLQTIPRMEDLICLLTMEVDSFQQPEKLCGYGVKSKIINFQ